MSQKDRKMIEVVCCKECKYWHELMGYGKCDIHSNKTIGAEYVKLTRLYDFCSF